MAISAALWNKSECQRSQLKPDSDNVFNLKTICYQLEHPSEIIVNNKGEMYCLAERKINQTWIFDRLAMGITRDYKSGHIYCAPPVLMALCIQRYDLAYKLIKSGYSTVIKDQLCKTIELQGTCVIRGAAFPFTIGQFIMGDPDMPDDLRLYLWHQIAQEKKQDAKIQGQPVGKVIDFGKFDFNENFCTCLFGGRNKNQNLYYVTFIKSLKMIAESRKRYLKNIVCDGWREILTYTDFQSYSELVCILLENVIVSEKQKLRLIQLDYINSMCKLFMDLKDLDKMATFLCKIEPYFRGENLKKAFFKFVVSIFLRYKLGMNLMREDSRRKQLESKIMRLIKRYVIKDFTLSQFLMLCRNCEVVPPDWFKIILVQYRNITGHKIILDGTVGFVRMAVFENQRIRMEGNTVMVDIADDDSWVEYVDRFSYSDGETVNTVQEFILRKSGQDMLLYAMRRKLFQDTQLESVIDYCMWEQLLQSKIPCILAYKNRRVGSCNH